MRRRLVAGVIGSALAALAWPVVAQPSEAHRDVLIDAPAAVAQLAAAGLDLGSVAFTHPAANNAELQQTAGWSAIVRHLTAALAARARADRQLGVGLRHPHRLFDARWLTAQEARLELVAVVNRMDRAPFASEGCGETRLVYRLAYRHGEDASRLPMTSVSVPLAVLMA